MKFVATPIGMVIPPITFSIILSATSAGSPPVLLSVLTSSSVEPGQLLDQLEPLGHRELVEAGLL